MVSDLPKCITRAILHTGQYAQRVGMSELPDNLNNAMMFGEVLSNTSYTTIFVEIHHGTDNPYEWGFDQYWSLWDGAANYFNPGEVKFVDVVGASNNWGQTYEVKHFLYPIPDEEMQRNPELVQNPGY